MVVGGSSSQKKRKRVYVSVIIMRIVIAIGR